MDAFLRLLKPATHARVLDLGGTVELWNLLPARLDVVLLNTSVSKARLEDAGRECRTSFTAIEGDACDLQRFAAGSFDIVFSNSVIEHLGDDRRVEQFAREVRRVGRSYWVQTPARGFPIEAHTGLPFFWYYPRPLRQQVARAFDRKYGGHPWSCSISETRSFRFEDLRRLFPDSAVYRERLGGLTKSWSMYRQGGLHACG